MRVPILDIEPVAIALDQLEASDQVRFSGIDLDNGSRVTVTIERSPIDATTGTSTAASSGLVLVLTMQKLELG